MVFLEEIKEFLEICLTVFLTQNWLTGQSVNRTVDRTKGRSTLRSTDVHILVDVWQHSGPVVRTRELCSLYPGGRPDQRALLSVSGRTTGRSTGFPQRSYF